MDLLVNMHVCVCMFVCGECGLESIGHVGRHLKGADTHFPALACSVSGSCELI